MIAQSPHWHAINPRRAPVAFHRCQGGGAVNFVAPPVVPSVLRALLSVLSPAIKTPSDPLARRSLPVPHRSGTPFPSDRGGDRSCHAPPFQITLAGASHQVPFELCSLVLRPFARPRFHGASSLLWPLLTAPAALAPGDLLGSVTSLSLRTAGLYLQRFVRPSGFAVACQLAHASGLTARSCSCGRSFAWGPFAPAPRGASLAAATVGVAAPVRDLSPG